MYVPGTYKRGAKTCLTTSQVVGKWDAVHPGCNAGYIVEDISTPHSRYQQELYDIEWRARVYTPLTSIQV